VSLNCLFAIFLPCVLLRLLFVQAHMYAGRCPLRFCSLIDYILGTGRSEFKFPKSMIW